MTRRVILAIVLALATMPVAAQKFDTTVRFSFDILDLVTNHQFEGQRNSFHVTYEYAAVLQGGGFDPKGHTVKADAFPYFQTVRDGIIEHVRNYPDSVEFYELFANNIARKVLKTYPQIRWIELGIDIPAYKDVQLDRKVWVRVARNSPRK